MKYNHIYWLHLTCFLLVLNCGTPDPHRKLSNPNVLFIAVDDLRDYIGVLGGHPDVMTPNIDRLANRGILFTNAHCQAPICAPSRASLLTGLRPSTTGHYYNSQPFKRQPIYDTIVTLPQHFREHGYTTLGCGKIHHGGGRIGKGNGPLVREWDAYFPSLTRAKFPEEVTMEKRGGQDNFYWGPSDQTDENLAEVQHANWAIRQLQREHDNPFFLAIGFYRPHLPFVAPRKYFELYDTCVVHPPLIKDDDLQDIPDAGRASIKYEYDHLVRTQQMERSIIHAYLSCVTYVDDQIGRVLDALDTSTYADNTIIVLWSDHGWHFGEKRTWRKNTLWEEATRVPMIIVPEGGKHGQKCHAPVQLLDLYPTLIAQCNLPPPKHRLEGHDLSPLLKDVSAQWDYPAITTNGRDNHALTTKKWHYIRYFDGTEELYDREKDPKNWHNIASDQAYESIKKNLLIYFPRTNAPNLSYYKSSFEKKRQEYPNIEEKLRLQKAFLDKHQFELYK